MAHKESKVDQKFIDTKFSSGDSNNMKSKQIYQEENNNVVNELVKGIADMGCIVDVAKCAPNVCIESCVYGGPEDDQTDTEKDDEEDAYSEDFDEDKSDDDDVLTMKTGPLDTADESNSSSLVENVSEDRDGPCTIVQMSKSHVTFMSSKMGGASGSGRSDFGSASVPGTRRVNMSFSNDRLREIQRHNHILLKKILCARNVQKSSIPPKETALPKRAVPHATMQRKRQQRQIDHDNMILLRKIQRAKSTACSFRR